MNQPKKPCEHVQGLIDYLMDNKIAVYPSEGHLPENVRCYRCRRIFAIDTSEDKKDGVPSYSWEEVLA